MNEPLVRKSDKDTLATSQHGFQVLLPEKGEATISFMNSRGEAIRVSESNWPEFKDAVDGLLVGVHRRRDKQ